MPKVVHPLGGSGGTSDSTETIIQAVLDRLLLGGVEGDLFVINKDESDNLFIDKISPTTYGNVLVDGGPDEIPFWDRISSAPGGLISDKVTLNKIITSFQSVGLITMDDTIDKEVSLALSTNDDNNKEDTSPGIVSELDASITAMDDTSDIEHSIVAELSGGVA